MDIAECVVSSFCSCFGCVNLAIEQVPPVSRVFDAIFIMILVTDLFACFPPACSLKNPHQTIRNMTYINLTCMCMYET